MESNLSKYLKNNQDLLDTVVDVITDIISCDDCPARKLCGDANPINKKECIEVFKEWSLKK